MMAWYLHLVQTNPNNERRIKMKSDVNGCSTTQAGQEQYEEFRTRGRKFVQYDYRTPTGKLFTCVAKTLAEARNRRDKWAFNLA
jgi:hypothetical protein